MRINEDIDGWVVIGSQPGLRELAFQRVTEWVPPRWPTRRIPSSCTSIFASVILTGPSRNYSLWGPDAAGANGR